jgi:hypothetical protein
MTTFNQTHYETLLPLKQKWEIFKLAGHVMININERKMINAVLKDIQGSEPDWCCNESTAINFKAAMNMFDKYEQTLPKKKEVVIPKKTKTK